MINHPKILIAIFILSVLIGISSSVPAMAETITCKSGASVECTSGKKNSTLFVSVQCTCCGDCSMSDAVRFFIIFIRFAIGITGSLALMMFIYGGFVILTSAGSPEKVNQGKNILTQTLIAIIIILGSWVLINFIISKVTDKNFNEVFAQSGAWWKIKD